jgi:hypothetical protein
MYAIKVASNLFGRAIRETGQAIDRIGLTIHGNEVFRETFTRHRPVMNLFDKVETDCDRELNQIIVSPL